jgi:hypothetical protein
MAKQHQVKTTRPRIVPLDCGYAVDVDDLTLVLKRDGDRWVITIDDAAQVAYWCDADDICHVVIEREQQAA